ncbi:TetR family transcriptional regulator [Arthrobacter sp. LAPM80]|uniref:TetR/AcrR family transcriptional regulator n=1 Tax=Arthrobacter sp. LAPM80 TaxID=3141788 RepID=UPI00398BAC6C
MKVPDWSAATDGPAEKQRRRHDPHRRARILDAALDVIAEHGVARTTHRKIAEAAGVPLGSVTYHFESLEGLVGEAFTKLGNRTADGFEAAMAAVGNEAQARTAVVSLITGEMLNDPRTTALSYELYALASRSPQMRHVTDAWMARSRAAIGRFFDPDTALMLDALIEGLSVHRALSLAPMPRTTVEAAVERIVRIS